MDPSKLTRADTAHWIRCREGVDVEQVRARFRAIDWSDLKYVDAAESYGARGYRSLSMGAVVDEYERCKTQTLTDIWHQTPDNIADWMMAADREKAVGVWRALGDQLGLSDRGKKQEWYIRREDEGRRDEADTRFHLPIIDGATGWDTWQSKFAYFDGLSFEDHLREGPALFSKLDDWLDQIYGVTPAWKKQMVAPS